MYLKSGPQSFCSTNSGKILQKKQEKRDNVKLAAYVNPKIKHYALSVIPFY